MKVYNFQQLKAEGKLTNQQFSLLSWLAYAEYGYQVYQETKFYHIALAYDNALRVLNVPEEIIFAVKQGNIRGLQNYNRIANTEYYNHNIGYYSNF